METGPTRAIRWMIGLPEGGFLGDEDGPDGVGKFHVEAVTRSVGCPRCSVVARVKDRPRVELVDLPVSGRPICIVWHKRRWCCPDPDCDMGSWTEEDCRIASPRHLLTTRAALWVTFQVGRFARSVNEVAFRAQVRLAHHEPCRRHTYGEALLEADDGRFGRVATLGLDEVLMVRMGPFHHKHFSTQIVDVRAGQFLDVVPGRSSVEPMAWPAERGRAFRDNIEFGTLDLSGPYRRVFEIMVPGATMVADPFHVTKLANTKLDECRRRVQNETLGHRGRKNDPLYRGRRLLSMAKERLGDKGHEKLTEILRAGDPTGHMATLWQAKEAVRELYSHGDPELALDWVTELDRDLQDADYPVEARSLGRTLTRWKKEIAAWHPAHVGNGPTEAVNNLIKRVKRAAFGFTSFRNCRIRALLHAGKPDWGLLPTVRPR